MREDWIEIEIGLFAKIQNGYAFKSKEYVEKGLRIVRIANVQSGKIIDRDPKFYPENRLSEFKDYVIEEDDFLISLTGNVGRVGRIDKSLLPALLNQRVGRLNLQTDSIEKSYLYQFLNSRTFVQQVIESSKGVAQLNTSSKKIEAIKIPIAPLPIQRAIVSKIESLFSDLDNGIANLKKAQEQLKIYRQAVLKKAFEGELTREWREKQSNLLTAEELLIQIKEERQNHYNKQIEEWKKAIKEWEENGKEGKKPIKPKAIKELPALTEDELKELPELPNIWNYNYLAYAGELARGKSKHRPRNDKRLFGGDYPFFQTGDVKAQKVLKNYNQTYNETGLAQSKLWKSGTLCITIAANIAETGFLGIDACFPDSIVGYAPFKKIIDNKYIDYFFQSAKHKISAWAPATAQKNINLTILENLVIPFCSLIEQHQIIQEIESRLSVCDKMEQSIIESLEKSKALRQSILKKAFAGRLLSEAEVRACKQEADYEPASVLLEKIKAEKLTKEKEAKKTKKRKK